jgi:hypothetical protein
MDMPRNRDGIDFVGDAHRTLLRKAIGVELEEVASVSMSEGFTGDGF